MRILITLTLAACTHELTSTDAIRDACGGLAPELNDYKPQMSTACRLQMNRDLRVYTDDEHPGAESFYDGVYTLLHSAWPDDGYSRIGDYFNSVHFEEFVENEPIAITRGKHLIIRADLGEPTKAASILYHETVHALRRAEAAHVHCPDGRLACDNGPYGAYGAQVWFLEFGAEDADESTATKMRMLAESIRDDRIL